MADPVQVITCSAECVVTVVHHITLPGITDLTVGQGAAIAGAVLAMWGVGFVYRTIAQALNERRESTESE